MQKGSLLGLGTVLLFTAFSSRAQQDLAQAGSLAVGSNWEVGVVFNQPVSRESASVLNHYSIPGGTIEFLRYVPLNQSVVLTVSGLASNTVYGLSITNLQNPSGTPYPDASITFSNKAMSWAPIGSDELAFGAEAVSVGATGFDLISGGIQMRDAYDESTFACETITGDFDRRVRLLSQEPSSGEARAGLMVREALNSGAARPTGPENAFARYLQIHIAPAATAFGEPGLHEYQVIARFYPGGVGSPTFEETLILTNSAPVDTNGWLRLRRRGQSFAVFCGADATGTNWVQLGSFSFPNAPFASTAFVGPNYSPENGNIPASENARRAFLARFRDYSPASGNEPAEPPTLRIVRIGNEVEITWEGGGTLQSSVTLQPGGWTNVAGGSPYRTAVAPGRRFFRVQL